MNMYFKRMAALVGILALTGTVDAVSVRGATTVKNKKHYEELTKGKPHVIVFSADWCGACKANYEIIEQVIAQYPDVVFVVVDADNQETVYLKKEHGLKALPSFAFVDANGKSADMLHRGMITKEKLERHVSKLSGKKAAQSPAPVAAKTEKVATMPMAASEKKMMRKEAMAHEPSAAVERRAVKKVTTRANGKKMTTKVTAKRTVICPADTK
ncbi:MAG TPA: thioredoxin family protein [Candidatus Babeliales bacterium]|nr:thioredoxin family protein [Candidatus Babeliales bacterium]